MKLTIVQQHVYQTKSENINHIETILKDPLETDIIRLVCSLP